MRLFSAELRNGTPLKNKSTLNRSDTRQHLALEVLQQSAATRTHVAHFIVEPELIHRRRTVAATNQTESTANRSIRHRLSHRFGTTLKSRHLKNAHRTVPQNRFAVQ